MQRRVLACALVLVAAVLLAIPSAWAVDYGAVGGKPANPRPDNPRTKSIFIYTLKAGQSTDDAIRVVNTGSQAKKVHLYPTDAVIASGGSFSCAQEIETKKDVGSWITLSTDTLTVPGNSDVVVPFSVTLPKNVEVGEHDGCIAIQDATQTQTDKSGVLLTFRTATRVAITVPGKIIKALQFQGVKTSQDNDSNLLVTPTIKNTGNVSLDTALTTTLQPIVGAKSLLNNGSYPILPHTTASWNFELKRPFWGGFYHAVVRATYDSDPAGGIGAKHTADKTITARSGVFYVAPQPLGLLLELVILALVIAALVYVALGIRRRRHVGRSWKVYEVKQNDTIVSVAKQNHIAWKRLAAANRLKAPYHLEPGQELKVPPKSRS